MLHIGRKHLVTIFKKKKVETFHLPTFTSTDHMFKELIKFMRHDKLIAEDEMPLPAPPDVEDDDPIEDIWVNIILLTPF